MGELQFAAQEPRGPVSRFFHALAPTLRYWMQTEVHVYAFSIAANVLLSLFPFLTVCVSLSRLLLHNVNLVNDVIDFALRDYFPDVVTQFLGRNLPRRTTDFISIFLLLFTANGIFLPLEVALNRVWGISKNRSFLRNQLISLMLIFGCGSLAMLSLWITALNRDTIIASQVEGFLAGFWLKLAAVPLVAMMLLLVYRFLPNGKPPWTRVVPAAIGAGLLLEVLKVVMLLSWPWVDAKFQREYGVFRYSASLIFLAFFASMVVLGGAEWAARGHRFDRPGLEDPAGADKDAAPDKDKDKAREGAH